MSVKIILLLAVAAAAHASSPYICRGYCPGQEDESPYAEHSRLYGRGYAVNQGQKKGLCSAKVQVLKPKSRDVDFWVCAKAGKFMHVQNYTMLAISLDAARRDLCR